MTELRDYIQRLISRGGPITLERYMELALAHPVHGYYMTRDPLGSQGDFVTAPEVSQMFGEMIGVWCADYWARMGAPDRVNLVELGPGRGTLMRDLLRAAKIVKPFFAALRICFVETSPVLRRVQKAKLENAGPPVAWFNRFEDVPAGKTIVIANEFFDALPAQQFVRTADGWHERNVGMNRDGSLCYSFAPAPERSIHLDSRVGAILEINHCAIREMSAIAKRIVMDGGVALAIDYGYTQPGVGNTFQAVRRHAYVDPLDDPGNADLTTHVNFAALAEAARLAGARVFGPIPQGDFLTRLGVRERATALASNSDELRATRVQSELARLIGKNIGDPEDFTNVVGMGGLFKALSVTQNDGPEPAGFAEEALAP